MSNATRFHWRIEMQDPAFRTSRFKSWRYCSKDVYDCNGIADSGCLSWILIFFIPNPGSKTKTTRGEKILFYLSVAINSTKLKIIKVPVQKKCWANWLRIYVFFPKKFFLSSQNSGIWDPRSGKKPIPNSGPGVKKAPDPGSGSATLDMKRCKDGIYVWPMSLDLLCLTSACFTWTESTKLITYPYC